MEVELSKIDKSFIINAVKEHPLLWDPQSHLYSECTRLWKEVAIKAGLENEGAGYYCRERWESILNKYYKVVKRRLKKKVDENEKYKFEHLLGFVNDALTRRAIIEIELSQKLLYEPNETVIDTVKVCNSTQTFPEVCMMDFLAYLSRVLRSLGIVQYHDAKQEINRIIKKYEQKYIRYDNFSNIITSPEDTLQPIYTRGVSKFLKKELLRDRFFDEETTFSLGSNGNSTSTGSTIIRYNAQNEEKLSDPPTEHISGSNTFHDLGLEEQVPIPTVQLTGKLASQLTPEMTAQLLHSLSLDQSTINLDNDNSATTIDASQVLALQESSSWDQYEPGLQIYDSGSQERNPVGQYEFSFQISGSDSQERNLEGQYESGLEGSGSQEISAKDHESENKRDDSGSQEGSSGELDDSGRQRGGSGSQEGSSGELDDSGHQRGGSGSQESSPMDLESENKRDGSGSQEGSSGELDDSGRQRGGSGSLEGSFGDQDGAEHKIGDSGSQETSPRKQDGSEQKRGDSESQETIPEDQDDSERKRDGSGSQGTRPEDQDDSGRQRGGAGSQERSHEEQDSSENRRGGSGSQGTSPEDRDDSERQRGGAGSQERSREEQDDSERQRGGSGSQGTRPEDQDDSGRQRGGSGSEDSNPEDQHDSKGDRGDSGSIPREDNSSKTKDKKELSQLLDSDSSNTADYELALSPAAFGVQDLPPRTESSRTTDVQLGFFLQPAAPALLAITAGPTTVAPQPPMLAVPSFTSSGSQTITPESINVGTMIPEESERSENKDLETTTSSFTSSASQTITPASATVGTMIPEETECSEKKDMETASGTEDPETKPEASHSKAIRRKAGMLTPSNPSSPKASEKKKPRSSVSKETKRK